jgi:hypothetical protein
MSRFIKLPSFFYEDNLLYFNDLWINPFQIESYTETEVSYTDENGIAIERTGVNIITRSGQEWGILLDVEQFETRIS